MTIEMNAAPTATLPPRSIPDAMLRGLKGTCPACGKGKLYASYLKVQDRCPACGEELHHHRADDAPPYFTIFIVGHILVAGILAMEQSLKPEWWLQLTIWLPMTVILSLLLLPRVKGTLVGLQWGARMHGFGDEQAAPPLDATVAPTVAER